jgi:hypothetical protein
MFKTVTRTWHVFSGCHFECKYCWAQPFILGRLQNLPKYQNGFEPTFHPKELLKMFWPGDFVGVALMGDINFADDKSRQAILGRISDFPQTNFLIQSKDPRVFGLWPKQENIYFGTTIETNRDYKLSKAPTPLVRYMSALLLKSPHKFISIEPVMDFDIEVLVRWLQDIHPEIVEVGADNYHHGLPEPSPEKVKQLLEALRGFVPRVVEKEGLERLKGGQDK